MVERIHNNRCETVNCSSEQINEGRKGMNACSVLETPKRGIANQKQIEENPVKPASPRNRTPSYVARKQVLRFFHARNNRFLVNLRKQPSQSFLLRGSIPGPTERNDGHYKGVRYNPGHVKPRPQCIRARLPFICGKFCRYIPSLMAWRPEA